MKLILSYLLVVIPLGWGVTKSIQKSRPLFTGIYRPAIAPPK